MFAEARKIMLYCQVNLPQDEKDKEYQKVLMKTSINLEKLWKGIQGNFMIKVVMANFLEVIDFEPKFPVKKVLNLIIKT